MTERKSYGIHLPALVFFSVAYLETAIFMPVPVKCCQFDLLLIFFIIFTFFHGSTPTNSSRTGHTIPVLLQLMACAGISDGWIGEVTLPLLIIWSVN